MWSWRVGEELQGYKNVRIQLPSCRSKRSRTCNRAGSRLQNSIELGITRNPDQNGGRDTGPSPNRARINATFSARTADDSSTALCADAQAPICESRGRVAKYESASASETC